MNESGLTMLEGQRRGQGKRCGVVAPYLKFQRADTMVAFCFLRAFLLLSADENEDVIGTIMASYGRGMSSSVLAG